MNARGSTEVIIATIGLSMGALSQNLFTMIVAMAVITTMAMPPTLRWATGARADAQGREQRLEREEFEGQGLRPQSRAAAAAVDDSANGKFGLATRRADRRHARHADDSAAIGIEQGEKSFLEDHGNRGVREQDLRTQDEGRFRKFGV